MEDLHIIEVTEENLERCQQLCDALMQFQAEKSKLHREILSAMNFENRLKASFLSSQNKLLLLAEYRGEAIGYAYANTYFMTEEGRYFLPDWLAAIYKKGQLVFYPEHQNFPANIGVFNNLYVLPNHHGKGIGLTLAKRLMDWLYQSETDDLYVYISNGNEKSMAPFYQQLGFAYSHAVLGGFIFAYHQKRTKN